MLRKLSVALLIAASPALAQDRAAAADQPQAEAVTRPESAPYKLKKVCRVASRWLGPAFRAPPARPSGSTDEAGGEEAQADE